MVNVSLLKSKTKDRGLTLEKLAEQIGMSRCTMSRKLSNHGADFTIKQANMIVNILGLSLEEANSIFFSQNIAYMQQKVFKQPCHNKYFDGI